MTSTSNVTEDDLQRQVASWLDVALPDGCVYHHSPNEGKRHINYINRLKKMGTKYGWPDLELFCPGTATKSGNNEAIFIALKAKRGVMNENKTRMRDQLLDAGFSWALYKSIDDGTALFTPLVQQQDK